MPQLQGCEKAEKGHLAAKIGEKHQCDFTNANVISKLLEHVRASTPEKHTLQNTQENGVSSFWLKKWGTGT